MRAIHQSDLSFDNTRGVLPAKFYDATNRYTIPTLFLIPYYRVINILYKLKEANTVIIQLTIGSFKTY